ncbi:hypothetical protein ASF40_03990 [Microbacterium sp. Leaf288]|uniref:hypothetical protein n=1 Tax=Microbacterium TaxID=33882 RepID=UPI0006F8DE65|nr:MULTISPECIES: hypothetical protein [Microbacterium]KQP70995.1 hypothetical protein ASF40_03990 [Microbacterium sp. Leaf288]MDR7113281.1 hypothetical protein [Microbacterium trichothecenolyticum]
MRITYRILSFAICALVALQAASHAWASAGLGLYIAEGGVVDASAQEGPPPFPEVMGFMIHGMNGMFVIPALALILLIVSFFAKIRRGVAFAAVVLGLVILQVTLGLFGHGIPLLGFFHGVNALLLFTAALLAGLNASKRRVSAQADAVATPAAASASA